MSGRHIVVDGVEYPVVEQMLSATVLDHKERLFIVRLPDGRERVAVWRLVRWEWEEGRDG
jgi:hypothetical protein